MLKPTRSRRQFVKLLGGLGAVWALPGCESLADKPISIASHVWVGYEPMFLARSEGWLDEKQVRIFETAAATESMRALAEGKVEGAALTLDEVFKARQKGQNHHGRDDLQHFGGRRHAAGPCRYRFTGRTVCFGWASKEG